LPSDGHVVTAGDYWKVGAYFVALAVAYVSVATSVVCFICPGAAGSGIPEV